MLFYSPAPTQRWGTSTRSRDDMRRVKWAAGKHVEVDVHSAWEGVTSRRSRGGASEGQGCGYGFGGG
jgi:hypothetical protein